MSSAVSNGICSALRSRVESLSEGNLLLVGGGTAGEVLVRYLYSLLHYLYMPVVFARLLLRSRENLAYRQDIKQRLGHGAQIAATGPVIWVHAVSVGEVQAAIPMVRLFEAHWPEATIVWTTTTPTGRDRVLGTFGADALHQYVPYDLPSAVSRFLNRVNPSLAVVLETEIWPNLLHQCNARSIPIILANARLSAQSAKGYGRVRGLIEPAVKTFAAVAAQTEPDAERLVGLGIAPERVVVTGSLKFDVSLPPSTQEAGAALRHRWGSERSVWIASSTHDGEEEVVLDAFSEIQRQHPDALLVLVPRHPERFARVAALCVRRKFAVARRSEADEAPRNVDVFVGDTMGELPIFYAASDVAFVGGSLVPIGGHNMLEPAALGMPVLLGPYLHNFAEIGERLFNEGAAFPVGGADDLAEQVVRFFRDPNLRHSVGERGKCFVAENRGARERVMGLITPHLK
ncbi:MAG: lipid IV(A) 3-deoxy-D-manno-octulosonic acid transferase [Gammaproteobacteria bacterium]|nr:lipid IV(A) 3-deoxy-D-manno-octulosonic acid transferase [Gammaproteobacteria bacterium]